MKNRPSRPIALLMLTQMLLIACSATAHQSQVPGLWPQPRPDDQPAPLVTRTVPNFQAPSAQHCARPVSTREIPGGQDNIGLRREMRDDMAATAS